MTGTLQRFPDFCSVIAVSHNAIEEPEHVHEVKPKSAIDALGVEVSGHRGVMPFHHHQPLTLETFHDTFPSSGPAVFLHTSFRPVRWLSVP